MFFALMLWALIVTEANLLKRNGAKLEATNRYGKPRVLVENGGKDLNMLVLNGSNAAD